MVRFPGATVHLFYRPKNLNRYLNFVASRKQQCLALLKSGCSSIKEIDQIHAQVHVSGLQEDRYLVSEIVRFCALSSSGCLEYARSLLSHAINPVLCSWNFVIRGYAVSNSPREAILVFLEMRRQGTSPSKLTFPFLLKACATLAALEEGRQIQVEIVKNGVTSDVYVQNTLIHFYGSCGDLSHAHQVFDSMTFRSVVSWNALMSAHLQSSCLHDSLSLFSQMLGCEIEPDEATMVTMLSACAELGNLSLGRWVHCQVIGRGMTLNCQLGTALVDMYAKCGVVCCARLVFDTMQDRNVWTWSAMILGLAQNGMAKEALDLFSKMKSCSVRPNYVTFIGVLCACSHAGLVDMGYQFFHEMKHAYGIKPMMIHYGSMVDILGRSGHLEEAYTFILNMPIAPDPVMWRTLLSACSIHDVESSEDVREKVRRRLLRLEPRRSGNLVMVANMYAEVGLWNEAANVRRVMRTRGLRKMAGESCIEVGGTIHRFCSGDDSQVDYKAIYGLLDALNLQTHIVNHE